MRDFTVTEIPISRHELAIVNSIQDMIGYDLRKMHIHNLITSLEIAYYPVKNIQTFLEIFEMYVFTHWSDDKLDEWDLYYDKFLIKYRKWLK